MLSVYRRILIRLSVSEAPIAADIKLTETHAARITAKISVGIMGDRAGSKVCSAVAMRV